MLETPESSPVFCSTCRWFDDESELYRCLHPAAVTVRVTPEGVKHVYATTHERNQYHDCPDFAPMTWVQRVQTTETGLFASAIFVTIVVLVGIAGLCRFLGWL